MRPCRRAKAPDCERRLVKLCGFQVGLDWPVFLIAGAHRNAEQGPRQRRGCDRAEARRGRIVKEAL